MWEVIPCLLITALALMIQMHIVGKLSETVICANKEGQATLAGQFKAVTSSAILPNPVGSHTYRIQVKRGTLKLNHHSYKEGGMHYSLLLGFGSEKYQDLDGAGIYTYKLNIEENDGKADKIELINMSLWEDVEFVYTIE